MRDNTTEKNPRLRIKALEEERIILLEEISLLKAGNNALERENIRLEKEKRRLANMAVMSINYGVADAHD